jgi:hypothetical protein
MSLARSLRRARTRQIDRPLGDLATEFAAATRGMPPAERDALARQVASVANTDFRRVAVHEASHAVVHVLVGYQFHVVTLKPRFVTKYLPNGQTVQAGIAGVFVEGESLQAHVRRVAQRPGESEPEACVRFLATDLPTQAIKMAGGWGELRFIGGTVDRQLTMAVTLDVQWMSPAARQAGWAHASRLLTPRWRTVEAVAEELFERRTLSYLEVIKIAKAAQE